jgi:hypothetical protein
LFHSAEEYERFISENPNDLKDKVFRFDLSVEDGFEYHFKPQTADSTLSCCNWEFNLTVAKASGELPHIFIEDQHFTKDFALILTAKRRTNDRKHYADITFRGCTFDRDTRLESFSCMLFKFEHCNFEHRFDVGIDHIGDFTMLSFTDVSFKSVVRLTQVGPGEVFIGDFEEVHVGRKVDALRHIYEDYRKGARVFSNDDLGLLAKVDSDIWRQIRDALLKSEDPRAFCAYRESLRLKDYPLFHRIRYEEIQYEDSESLFRRILRECLPESEARALSSALIKFTPERVHFLPLGWKQHDGRSVRPNGL